MQVLIGTLHVRLWFPQENFVPTAGERSQLLSLGIGEARLGIGHRLTRRNVQIVLPSRNVAATPRPVMITFRASQR